MAARESIGENSITRKCSVMKQDTTKRRTLITGMVNGSRCRSTKNLLMRIRIVERKTLLLNRKSGRLPPIRFKYFNETFEMFGWWFGVFVSSRFFRLPTPIYLSTVQALIAAKNGWARGAHVQQQCSRQKTDPSDQSINLKETKKLIDSI